jgi:hypothetical protein
MKRWVENWPMGHCATIKEMLSGYIDKDLSEQDEEKVREHLASCQSCRVVFQQVEDIRSHLGSLESFKISTEFNEKLRKRIEAAEEKKSSFGVKGLAWSLATFVVIIASYFIFMTNSPEGNSNDQTDKISVPAKKNTNSTASPAIEKSPDNAVTIAKHLDDTEENRMLPLKGDTATNDVKTSNSSSINLIEEKK